MIRRLALCLTLLLALAAAAAAQEAQPAPPPATTAEAATVTTATAVPAPAVAVADETRTPQAIRERFIFLLDRHPEGLGRVLGLDPTLLSNREFLAKYPEVAQFLAENPEIVRNPHYYVDRYEYTPPRPRNAAEEIFEALSIAFVFLLIAYSLAWIVRAIIEQKRWNRLSRTQAEVHTKILDRFGSSEELLAYMKTPAGSKFLESAPIPVRTESARGWSQPYGRTLWSVQAGVVIAAAGLGMLLVSLRFDQETAQDLFAVGVVALSIGIGFIASAAVSVFMSRRLGLLQEPPSDAYQDAGTVR
ncbi:MAG TPA: hypothetical protein VGF40_13820 [Thermoanaerobaculia bacterium]